MYKRIISLAPSNTEIIYALGAQDKLIACTRYCDFPNEAKSKPKIGGWLDINDELVRKFNPDLILTSTFVQDKITEKYKNEGMNIVALMPRTFEDIFETINEIGRFVGKSGEALELNQSIKNEIQIIQNSLKNKKSINENMKKSRVYIEEWHKPPHVSGNWVPKMVEISAGEYTLIKEGIYSREVSTEEILNYDPEIIILSICGIPNAPKEWVTNREEWKNLSAVKNNKVFVFDDSLLNRPGPRLVEGIKKLVEVIHS